MNVDEHGRCHDECVEIGDLHVCRRRSSVMFAGRYLRLTRKEFLLLELFAKNPGRLLRREQIAREVWGGHAPGRTIDVHVARLRAKLHRDLISTIVRVGYRFTPT